MRWSRRRAHRGSAWRWTEYMKEELAKLRVLRKQGTERFRNKEVDLGFNLLSFWQWSASDLVSNATRGILAEYIVAQALDIAGNRVRDEWAAFDLVTEDGIKIEVKSAAYVQIWHQERLSTISFRTPQTLAWDADTNIQSKEPRRQADVYVFALLAHKDKSTINPMDVSQWEFFTVRTGVLDSRKRSQHSITLPGLRKICGKSVTYSDLRNAVYNALS